MLDYADIQSNLLDWVHPEPPTDRQRRLAADLEHGDYEIYGHKLDAALDEARAVFVRTAVSSMAKSGDLVVGLHDARGDLVTASCGTYLHAPLAQLPVKYLIHYYLERESNVEVNPGDIFYANEALAGGLHNPDQIAIMPIFHEDELMGWASGALHQPETGAIEPGGMPQTATSRYDEGMRLTPIKLAEDYEIRDDLMDMMVNFISRSPRMQEIDVRARCTSVDKLRQRVEEIAAEAGPEFVHGLFRRMIDAAEAGARSRIESWPDGTYRATGFYDTPGGDHEGLMKVALAVEKTGDDLRLDFTGTSPEAGSYNSFGHAVSAYMAAFLYPYVFHDLPVSGGVFAPFDFEIPRGSMLSASAETSVANCIFVGRLVVGLCHDVFTRMLYATDAERTAASPATHAGASAFSGRNQHGVSEADMVTFTLNTDGAGARPDLDGVDAHGFFFAPWGEATNTEDREESRMFLGLSRQHLPDSGGFGKHRGGAGTQYFAVVTSESPVWMDTRGIGTRIPFSGGVFGGYNGTSLPGVHVTDTAVLSDLADGEDVPMDVRDLVTDRDLDGEYHFHRINHPTYEFGTGDVKVNLCGGGGGFGDPLERDPGAVADDIRVGVATEWTAEHVYRVAFDEDGVDAEATADAREDERNRRLERGVPFEEFREEWEAKRPPEEALEFYGEWPFGMRPTEPPRDDPLAGGAPADD